MRRSLTLSKETLAELTPNELGVVGGGQVTTDCHYVSEDCYYTYRVGCLISRLMDPCLSASAVVC